MGVIDCLLNNRSNSAGEAALHLTFHSENGGEWAFVGNRFANMLAYERAGEFRIANAGGAQKLDCYDGVGTNGPAFSIGFVSSPDSERRIPPVEETTSGNALNGDPVLSS